MHRHNGFCGRRLPPQTQAVDYLLGHVTGMICIFFSSTMTPSVALVIDAVILEYHADALDEVSHAA
jgi:hypothetical protein